MAVSFNHIHVKTVDPKAMAQYYIDNFGAKMIGEIPGRGVRVDLHGTQLNITTFIDVYTHEQKMGFEHVAVTTDDFDGTMATLKKNGVKILEELQPQPGRRIAFVEGFDGARMEVIQKV